MIKMRVTAGVDPYEGLFTEENQKKINESIAEFLQEEERRAFNSFLLQQSFRLSNTGILGICPNPKNMLGCIDITGVS